MSNSIDPADSRYFRHYKGGEYELIGIGRDSETLAEVVIYRALYDDEKFGPKPIWVRPKEMFFGEVEKDGKIIKRFKEIKCNDQ